MRSQIISLGGFTIFSNDKRTGQIWLNGLPAFVIGVHQVQHVLVEGGLAWIQGPNHVTGKYIVNTIAYLPARLQGHLPASLSSTSAGKWNSHKKNTCVPGHARTNTHAQMRTEHTFVYQITSHHITLQHITLHIALHITLHYIALHHIPRHTHARRHTDTHTKTHTHTRTDTQRHTTALQIDM